MADIPNDALIVIADGRGAKLFRNTGSAEKMVLKLDSSLLPKDLEDDGPSGSRPEEQTPHQTDEATFAKQLANKLHVLSLSKSYVSLVLIADPQSLGQIRDVLHNSVKDKILFSLNKDLTNHTLNDIEAALRKADVAA